MRFGFWLKIALAAVLVIAFERLFKGFAGFTIGLFAFAWLTALVIARRDARRHWPVLAAAAIAAAALAFDPGPLAGLLFLIAIGIAALLGRTAGFDDALRWAIRLALLGLSAPFAPLRDLMRLWRGRRAGERPAMKTVAATLALPLAGTIVFVLLFANANPLIGHALGDLRLPYPHQFALWVLAILLIWPTLRPHPLAIRAGDALGEPRMPFAGPSLVSVLIGLALFNAVFAVQNALDIAFLWSGAPLPAGVTPAGYAHQGAYPLIVTALIAGALAIVMLQPGSAAAASTAARRLVTLWVAQNLVLVASSALRTIDYIEVSMLTAWRIAALIWMALVAFGLVLILWRILAAKSGRWLINTNAAACALTLFVCAFLDLGGYAAGYNIRAADPAKIDLCYLRSVGDGAIAPVIALERRPLDPVRRGAARTLRDDLLRSLRVRQARWQDWTIRGASRLAHADAALGPNPPRPSPLPSGAYRKCDGSISLPPPPPATPVRP